MFLREMNPLHGLLKKKYSFRKKKQKAQGIPGTGRSESQITDPLNMRNERLEVASLSALEIHGSSLESDFMSHPTKDPQT